jgi:hypothetical protein
MRLERAELRVNPATTSQRKEGNAHQNTSHRETENTAGNTAGGGTAKPAAREFMPTRKTTKKSTRRRFSPERRRLIAKQWSDRINDGGEHWSFLIEEGDYGQIQQALAKGGIKSGCVESGSQGAVKLMLVEVPKSVPQEELISSLVASGAPSKL